MARASTIWLDIAKQGLQAHGADAARQTVFRTRLTRAKVSGFFCVTSSVSCRDGSVRRVACWGVSLISWGTRYG